MEDYELGSHELDESLDSGEQVLAAHGDELRHDAWAELPEAIRALKPKIEFEPWEHEVMRRLVFERTEGELEVLELVPLDISWLAGQYPCCDLGF